MNVQPLVSPSDEKLGRKSPKHKAQPLETFADPDALLKVGTVETVTGLSAATIYRRVAVRQFPEPVRLGNRCTRWRARDIRAWLAAQEPVTRHVA